MDWLSFTVRWRWWFIGIVGFLYTAFEFSEHAGFNMDALFEVLLLVLLLVCIGFLMGRLLAALNAQQRDAQVLEWRHNLSLQLGMASGADDLANKILENLAAITRLEYAFLLIYDPDDTSFACAAEWCAGEHIKPDPALLQPAEACQDCALKEPRGFHAMKSCEFQPMAALPEDANAYCLPLIYADSLIAAIRFVLPPDHLLSKDERDILNNVGFEIAVALVMTQQREVMADIKASDASLAERRNFSRDLHDTLGQNLAYMRLKLEQLSKDHTLDGVAARKAEIKNLLVTTDESLGLVRGMLSVLGYDTQVNIERLIHEHGRIISERAGFSLSVSRHGQPRSLPSHIQREIIYIYREILSNIERHAAASQVDVALDWGEEDLCIQIQDNGKGFDTNGTIAVDHFGLGIMKERAEMVHGKVKIASALQQGTHIQLWVPI
jgi:signal transduction histidine kinase